MSQFEEELNIIQEAKDMNTAMVLLHRASDRLQDYASEIDNFHNDSLAMEIMEFLKTKGAI